MKSTASLALSFLGISSVFATPNQYPEVLSQLTLPSGFSISIFADNLPNARTLALGENGIIYIGTRQKGNVYAVQDTDNDGFSDKSYTLANNLYMPNGVAYKNGALYVAQPHQIIRFNNIAQHLKNPPKPSVVYKGLPSDKHHGWKYLRFGADNKLYSAVGAPCNICEPTKAIYSSLFRVNTDGSDFEILATGIRNTVGFDWHPETKQLYFTENGRDHLGENIPADELNLWTKKGQHFGYPYCHAGELLDPEFGKNKNCADFTPPVWKFKAHNAPLGIRFYQGDLFPAEYKNQLFVAQHGSWNRSIPDGYRIALVEFKEGKAVKEKVFISGWLTEKGKVLGRPTDILELPNGNLLIADDTLGLIYQVTYKK